MPTTQATRERRFNWLLLGSAIVPVVAFGLVWLHSAEGRRWEEIRSFVRDERRAEAEAALIAWVATHPKDGDAWELLAHVHLDENRHDEALEALRRVPRDSASWTHAQAEIGKLLLDRHDLPGAERTLRAAIARDPKSIEAYQRLLPVLVLERRLGEARDVLRQLYKLTRDPRPLADSLLLGQLESEVRDQGQDLAAHFERTPDDPWVRRAWAMLLLSRGQPAEARPHLEAAALAFDDDPLGRYALAECRMAMRDPARDIAVLGTPPMRTADAARWWVLRSRLEEIWGRGDDARSSLLHAVELDPRSVEAHYRLGQAMTRAGDETAGKFHLDDADVVGTLQDNLKRELRGLLREGHDAESLVRIGRLCRQLGLPEARDWLELALRADPRRDALRIELSELPASADDGPALAISHPIRRNGAPMASDGVVTSRDGVVESAFRFEEIASGSEITYQYNCGETPELFIGDTMGGGVGLIDYDGDGRLDIYFVNGCRLPIDPTNPATPNKLYRNRGDGSFEDVTAAAGVAGRGYGMGCAVADYDGDGDDDLFVTGLENTILYRNRGDGTFEDVTTSAGVASSRWTTAPGFADLDGDGDLDLMVVTYVAADPTNFRPCRDRSGRLIHCQPERFEAQFDQLFRNDGDGTFTDISKEAGIEQSDGRGLGLAIIDYDDDGRLDLFVANDGTANYLFRNLGNLRFEELAMSAGAAYDAAGQPTASMGVVSQDLNGDGRIDLLHTNFLNQSCTLRLNAGGGLFIDGTLASGLAIPTRAKTGWGVLPIDVDNDGWWDLFMANGHVDDQPWFNTPMAQEPLLFRGGPGGRFETVGQEAGAYFTRPVAGRGAVAGDFDEDGRVDLIVVHRDAPAVLLRNVSPGGHWLGIRLRGVESAPLPVGARVACQVGGRTLTRWVTSGTGYLSTSDPRVWFGLGEAAVVERLEVRWPSGRVQEWTGVAADRTLDLKEGQDLVESAWRGVRERPEDGR